MATMVLLRYALLGVRMRRGVAVLGRIVQKIVGAIILLMFVLRLLCAMRDRYVKIVGLYCVYWESCQYVQANVLCAWCGGCGLVA